MENGKFVKADIFEHPVSFAVESHANVGSPEEALSASLNKFGTVDLDYMREITDSTAEDLLTALQGRIYYNPLVTGYEIKGMRKISCRISSASIHPSVIQEQNERMEKE